MVNSVSDITQEELRVFLEETSEQLRLMDEDILKLYKGEDNQGILQEIFRAAHTIKGSSSLVGNRQMTELSHRMENLLDGLRNEEIMASPDIIERLLSGIDTLRVLKDEMISVKVIGGSGEDTAHVRMVPIGIIFDRFSRMVKELADSQKKKVDLIIEGRDTRLDRSIAEQVRDPIVQLLRNAIDHGVETPEERISARKQETAVVCLAAWSAHSDIVIRVDDDGRGIDADNIVKSALEKKLISVEEAKSLNVEEAINLIFLPGMTTAIKASEVSGRGVGMDIVRANIEHLGGLITIDTRAGRGSKFTIRIPAFADGNREFRISIINRDADCRPRIVTRSGHNLNNGCSCVTRSNQGKLSL